MYLIFPLLTHLICLLWHLVCLLPHLICFLLPLLLPPLNLLLPHYCTKSTFSLKVTEYRQTYMLKVHNEIHFVVVRNSSMVSTCKQELMFMHDCNDIHNVATNVWLTWWPTQQLFTVLFFLSKFKTLGSTLEPGLATKLCVKALSSKWMKLFRNVSSSKSY